MQREREREQVSRYAPANLSQPRFKHFEREREKDGSENFLPESVGLFLRVGEGL